MLCLEEHHHLIRHCLWHVREMCWVLVAFQLPLILKLASHVQLDAKRTGPELIELVDHSMLQGTFEFKAYICNTHTICWNASLRPAGRQRLKMLFKVFDQHLACLRQKINSCKDVIFCLPTNLCCSLHIHSKHPYYFCKLHCLDLHSLDNARRACSVVYGL